VNPKRVKWIEFWDSFATAGGRNRAPALSSPSLGAEEARIPPDPGDRFSGSDLIPTGQSRSIRVMSSETSQSYRYIVRSPDVRGGHARVEGTRIGVHDVIGLLQNGETVDSLVGTCLPMLTRAQVYECLAYYEDHRGEIDLLVARQMAHDQR